MSEEQLSWNYILIDNAEKHGVEELDRLQRTVAYEEVPRLHPLHSLASQ